MALSILILSLLLSTQLSSLVVAHDHNPEVCNAYSAADGTPIGIHRTCSVYHGDNYSCPNNNFYHEWKATQCGEGRYLALCEPLDCPGFVGMNLTYECSFDGARLYRYKDGKYQYLNGSSVNYGLLLPEHAGLYECRNSATGTVHAQNITVNGMLFKCAYV